MKLDNIHKSIVSRLPSVQDLISAIATFQIGKPSVIYPEDGGYILLRPIKGMAPKVIPEKYNELIQSAVDNNDLDIVVNGLREMGFEMSGEADGKIGKSVSPELQSNIKQAATSIPTASGREVGGVSSRGEGGKRATEIKRTGTKDHVEMEIEYDPESIIDPSEALDDIDDTFVFHTHPKMSDNNYFPGKMQRL